MRQPAANPGPARCPRSAAAARLAALAMLVVGAPAGAAPPAGNTVVLLWFDPLETLPDGFEEVGREVAAVFQGIGVDVQWRRGSPGASFGPDSPPRVPVILLPEDPARDRRAAPAMGVVLRGEGSPRVVWVFVNNVRSALGRDVLRRPKAEPDEARPLALAVARVMAHEVVHAIAPDEPHSRDGLMRKAMDRSFLLGGKAALDPRLAAVFLSRLAAYSPPPDASHRPQAGAASRPLGRPVAPVPWADALTRRERGP